MKEKDLYNEIGKNIKKRRKELGITQEKLADLTYFSDSFIANIESTTFQSFSISALNTIAKALDTSIKELLPKEYLVLKKDNILKCGNCNYNAEIPLELIKMLQANEDIFHEKFKLTCPKCNKKITY